MPSSTTCRGEELGRGTGEGPGGGSQSTPKMLQRAKSKRAAVRANPFEGAVRILPRRHVRQVRRFRTRSISVRLMMCAVRKQAVLNVTGNDWQRPKLIRSESPRPLGGGAWVGVGQWEPQRRKKKRHRLGGVRARLRHSERPVLGGEGGHHLGSVQQLVASRAAAQNHPQSCNQHVTRMPHCASAFHLPRGRIWPKLRPPGLDRVQMWRLLN